MFVVVLQNIYDFPIVFPNSGSVTAWMVNILGLPKPNQFTKKKNFIRYFYNLSLKYLKILHLYLLFWQLKYKLSSNAKKKKSEANKVVLPIPV